MLNRRHWLALLASWGVVAAGLVTLAVMANAPSGAGAGTRPTVRLAHGTVEATVLASGVLQAEEMVNLGVQVSGQLKRLHVGLGDHVQAGQLVAEVEAAAQETAVEMARHQLSAALAQQRASRVEADKQAVLLTRQRELLAGQGTSREAVEAAAAAYAASLATHEVATAHVREAEGALKTAQLNQGYTAVHSPIDGQVVAVLARQGQMLNANFAAPNILKVARVTPMRIRANISELDVGRVHAGQPASFATLGQPDDWKPARLQVIEPLPVAAQGDPPAGTNGAGAEGAAPDGTTPAVYFGAVLTAEQPASHLRVGMTVLVRVVVERATDAWWLPAEAVSEGAGAAAPAADQAYVQVMKPDGSTEVRQVHIGVRNATQVQVLSGLRQDERVLLPRGI